MTLDSPSIETDAAAPEEVTGYAARLAVHVVFVPDRAAPRFFVWGKGAAPNFLGVRGTAASETFPDESLQLRKLDGFAIPLLQALAPLASIRANDIERISPSLAAWSLAAKLALDLVARQRVVPSVAKHGAKTYAQSRVALGLRDDHDRVRALAKAFPLAAHAIPIQPVARAVRKNSPLHVWTADGLLRAFLDSAADSLVRAGRDDNVRKATADVSWSRRLVRALRGPAAEFVPEGFQERSLLEELDAWVEPVLGGDATAPRACFRIELPREEPDDAAPSFSLRFLLQAADDPTLCVGAADIFSGRRKALAHIHCTARIAEERLLQSLSVAGHIFPPTERSLHAAKPEGVELTAELAWKFLNEAVPALTQAGMSVILPPELTRSGQRRLRMRMRIGKQNDQAHGAARLSMRDTLPFRWEAEIDGEPLTAKQLKELAALKAPLVRYRGRWVAVDCAELEQAARLLTRAENSLTATAALAAALGTGVQRSDIAMPIEVAVEGHLAHIVEQLRAPQPQIATPAEFRGVMRPYQERGLAWLVQMAQLGLGACLADDMGLGKTIQLLALLLHRRATQNEDPRPVLLVCPTSVIGNWQRELARFAPTLNVVQHYGIDRARDAAAFAILAPATVAITSYGLLRRDAAVFGEIDWAVIALDEAQNIKNPESRTARVARSLHGDVRIALTGTPMENRLTELWSIFEFLNPGLLGPLAAFQREVAAPIERFGREDVSERLKRIVRPLLLRRVKSDPAIIQDLPPKQEMDVYCTLVREQAALYQAAVDAAMVAIEGADGIARRGHVLALITALKQICNHPAQYLHEDGPLADRSGKLERLIDMLEEVVAGEERALIFTQYREMGGRLASELTRRLRTEVLFLHGGTPREHRERMVKRFQDKNTGPKIFILSVKAGGTGLNLTAATHVFHYDRWWNPAVEDQATDRAYRIGQQQRVLVHKFLCAGTIEEKIDGILKAKRDLVARIVGEGEQWLTELDDNALRELFALSPGAVIDNDASGDSDMEAA